MKAIKEVNECELHSTDSSPINSPNTSITVVAKASTDAVTVKRYVFDIQENEENLSILVSLEIEFKVFNLQSFEFSVQVQKTA